MTENNEKFPSPNYAPSEYLIDWLESGIGRSAYFSRVDSGLTPPVISKLKYGIYPITFEYAVRLERAQRASAYPLQAELLMTFPEDRALYRYVTGQEAAPVQLPKVPRKPRKPMTSSTNQPLSE